MPFINEFISKDDMVKFGLAAIDERFIVGGVRSTDWTIDRKRNVYLRLVARGREDESHKSTWIFYWGGENLVVELENISTSGPVGGVRKGHKKLNNICMPKHLQGVRQQVLDDLREALTAYKDGGVYSTASDYSLIFDF